MLALSRSNSPYFLATLLFIGFILLIPNTGRSQCIGPTITLQPINDTTCVGVDVTFTISVTGTSPTLQWQNDTGPGGTFIDILGGTGPSITISGIVPSLDGRKHRCLVTVSCIPTVITSDTAEIVLNPLAPIVTCGPDPVEPNVVGTCGATVTVVSPSFSDECPLSQVPINDYTLTDDASGFYPVGIEAVTWTLTDSSGNVSAPCIQLVTVTDTQAPVLGCPADTTFDNDLGVCGANLTFPPISFSDNCGISTSPVNDKNGSANASGFYPIGTTTVTWTLDDDAGISALPCSYDVTVQDTTKPSITCPGDITTFNTPGACNKLISFSNPTIGDNCPSASFTQIGGIPSGFSYPVAIIINTFQVTDASLNSVNCSFTVTVQDSQHPVINCPSDTVVSNNPGDCDSLVIYSAVTATDNCPLSPGAIFQIAGLASGLPFPVGTTPNTYVVQDLGGNTDSCTFLVTVNDVDPPLLFCPPNITEQNDPTSCSKLILVPAPSESDNCPTTLSPTNDYNFTASGSDIYPVGITTVRWDFSDDAGNPAISCTHTISVTDTQAPVINCPLDTIIPSFPGDCSFPFTYVPDTSDNCQGIIVSILTGLPSGSDFPVGTTELELKAVDVSGNSDSCIYFVTVVDDESPTISCPGDTVLTHDPGFCGATFIYPTPNGTDNCLGATTLQISGIPSGGFFSVGITENQFVVVDSAGLEDSCKFSVEVLNPMPLVSINGLDSTYCTTNPIDTLFGSPSGGVYSGPGMSDSLLDPSLVGIGVHSVEYYYTDVNGCVDSAEGEFTIVSPPVISFSGLGDFYCPEEGPVTLFASPNGGVFSGPGVSGTQFTPSMAGSGLHQIFYEYTWPDGCVSSVMDSVNVWFSPSVSFSGLDSAYCKSDPLSVLEGFPSGGLFLGSGISSESFSPFFADTGTVLIEYIYSDSNGCTAVDSQITDVNPQPVTTLSGLLSSYCINGGSSSLIGLPSGGTFFGAGLLDSIFYPNLAGLGNHTFDYIYEDTNGCSDTSQAITIVNDKPSIGISGNPGDYCDGDSPITLTGIPSGGTFWGPGISGNIFSPGALATGLDSIWYSYIDGNGCSDSTSSIFEIHPLPIVSFGGISPINCLNGPENILFGIPSGGIYSGNGIIDTIFNPSNAGSGFHIINYFYTDSFGCSSSANIPTTVINPPVVNFGGLNTEYCFNDGPGSLIGLPSGGTFSGPGVSGNLFVPALAGDGYHLITYSFTDLSGCSSTDSQYVTVFPLPNPTFGGFDSDYCISDGQETLVANPSGGIFTGAGIVGNVFNPSLAGIGTHSVNYFFTDSNTCSNSISQNLIVHTLPTVNFIGLNSDYCVDDNPASLTGSPSGGLFIGNGMVDTVFHPDLSGVGITPITYVYEDSNTCLNSISRATFVHALPTPTLGGLSPEYCISNGPSTLTGSPSGGLFSGPGVIGNSFSPATAGLGSHQIIYSYTDLNGCIGRDTLETFIHPLPTPSIGNAETDYCISSPLAILTGVPAGGVFSGPGITDSIFAPVTAGIGTHIINYVYSDSNGCTNQTSENFSVHALPLVSISGLNTNYCIDESFSNLVGSPSGGVFTGPGISDSDFYPFTAGVGIHTIDYFYTDSMGCGNFSSQVVTVFDLPIVSFSGLSSTYCTNDPVSVLIGFPSGGTFGGPGISGSTFSPSTAGVGLHTITYSSIDINGCSNSDTFQTEVFGIPTPSFNGLPPSFCIDGVAQTLSGVPSGGAFSGTGIISNIFSPTISGIGNHVVTYTYTDLNGCTVSSDQNTEVHALPTPVFSGLGSDYCEDGADVSLIENPIGGVFSGTGMFGNTFSPSIAGLGIHIITYNYVDGNGCSENYIDTVEIHSKPSLSISGMENYYCHNSQIDTLSANPPGGLFWGEGITGTTFNPLISGTGWATINYSYTNGFGCFTLLEDSVFVHPLPIPYFSGLDLSYCENDTSISLQGLPVGGVFSGPGVSMASFTPNIAGPGVHSIIYSYTDSLGCSNTAEEVSEVFSLPITSFSGLEASLCESDGSVNLIGTPSGGTFSGNGIFGNTFEVQNVDIGEHQITYQFIDGNGCVGMDSQIVEIMSLPLPNFSGLSIQYCEGDLPVILTPTSFGGTFLGNGITGNQFNPSTAGPGNHSIQYSITNINGCSDTSTQFTSVSELPQVNMAGLAQNYCVNDSEIEVLYSPTGGVLSGNGIVGNFFHPSMASSGSHTITYSFANQNGCSNTASHSLTVYDLPNVTLGGNQTICKGDSITINAGNPGATFDWNTGTFTQTLTITEQGWYKVTVTSPAGCLETDSMHLAVDSVKEINVNYSECPEIVFSASTTQNTPTSWDWIFGDGGSGIGDTISHEYLTNGTYMVTLTGANGCGISTRTTEIFIDCLVGVSSQLEEQAIQLFPNPGNGQFTIETKNLIFEQASIKIIDQRGREVYSKRVDRASADNHYPVDISGLSNGVYMVSFIHNQQVFTTKFLKN